MCVHCTVTLINISYDPSWNPALMSQIRACLSLPYYLRQSTVLDVLTKTWTVLCGEQIRTSVELVSVTMLRSVICSFLLLSVRTTLPVAWYIYRHGSVCLSCKIAFQNISYDQNWNPTLLSKISDAEQHYNAVFMVESAILSCWYRYRQARNVPTALPVAGHG